jgi:hypothetical protein
MIENVQFVRNCNRGHFQLLNRANYIAVSHVAVWIIVYASEQDAWMLAACRLDQQVQVLEVLVIPAKYNESVPYREDLMTGIGYASGSDVGRRDDLVTGLPQAGDERRLGAVVVQIQIHSSGS